MISEPYERPDNSNLAVPHCSCLGDLRARLGGCAESVAIRPATSWSSCRSEARLTFSRVNEPIHRSGLTAASVCPVSRVGGT